MSDKPASKTPVDKILSWHKALHSDDSRAARARLRRCDTLMDALSERETHLLLQQMRDTQLSPARDNKVIMLAVLLAHIKPRGSEPFAKVLGSGGQTLMKPLRFNSLMQAMQGRDISTRLRSLRRAVMLIGDGGFNVEVFVKDILFFNDETARRWTYEYWQTPLNLQAANQAAEITAETAAAV